MSQRAHLILSWVIVALWAGVIFFMSAHTGSDFDGTGPLAIYEDIYTHLLPESDVLALQQGVQVADEVELQRRLEDYGL